MEKHFRVKTETTKLELRLYSIPCQNSRSKDVEQRIDQFQSKWNCNFRSEQTGLFPTKKQIDILLFDCRQEEKRREEASTEPDFRVT